MTATKQWHVNKNVDNLSGCPQIQEAAACLKGNEVVAFPTETVYGLGGNALSDEAIEKIYRAKGRPSDNPLIVHVASLEQLHQICDSIPDSAQKLIDAFWPGPLTIVLPKTGALSKRVTAGLSTVAVRMPEHPVAHAIIKAANLPIAAPSANSSGRPSPTLASHVLDDLNGKIAGVVDGGASGVGVESTVVDCTVEPVAILRPGGVTREQLEAVVGKVTTDPALSQPDKPPKSPGMKYQHYAPEAPVYLVAGGKEKIQELAKLAQSNHKRVGVLTTEENKCEYPMAAAVIACGKRADLASVAHCLYDSLRAFDETHVDIILSETFPMKGIGAAIMNRLSKAAGGRTIE
ncbi:L-threonylcarbamoyladenylate synthase [Scopulibacillus daqui]|uniref:Threonylcarbamoyl-AMP synthase n=1 Tax=Scopulibacillus daqui TaxID=1469162 RepID=A0ABS2PZ93_9BACL|nr:L-threonylcarbamoyladenylate synthase [Scopulibacillus daqui]MBM7645374.1 L-threonylcarbamoyladenylate synthase [Scopulibacillus daqui]